MLPGPQKRVARFLKRGCQVGGFFQLNCLTGLLEIRVYGEIILTVLPDFWVTGLPDPCDKVLVVFRRSQRIFPENFLRF